MNGYKRWSWDHGLQLVGDTVLITASSVFGGGQILSHGLLCLWDFPDHNTEVHGHFLLQRIFLNSIPYVSSIAEGFFTTSTTCALEFNATWKFKFSVMQECLKHPQWPPGFILNVWTSCSIFFFNVFFSLMVKANVQMHGWQPIRQGVLVSIKFKPCIIQNNFSI